jgi:biopolymer transport protein ExbD
MVKKGVTAVPQSERVFLQADPDVLYEDFMAVLNVLQENGYFKVGIINEDIE